MMKSTSTKPKQTGAMLLEALIAILIFSMGILAVIGMQAAAIRNSSDAKYRADASYLANSILGQMWADRNNLAAYAHRPSGATCAPSGAASANPNVTAWLASVSNSATGLPGATAGTQQIVVGANRLVTVTVCWRAPQDTGFHNFQLTSQING